MTNEMLDRYSDLLLDYSLDLKEGEKLFVKATCLAEPLINYLYKKTIDRGAIMEFDFEIESQAEYLLANGNKYQLHHIPSLRSRAMKEFDAYLAIRSPYHLENKYDIPKENRTIRSEVLSPILKEYYKRTADGSMKRSLCQYPTQAAADAAYMDLESYAAFIYKACKLDKEDPKAAWLELRKHQQGIVDYLNKVDKIQYLSDRNDISFSVKNRIWINSDGRTNMPSGEVFTGPIEDSVNGYVRFDYPAVYRGKTVSGIRLEVKDGLVTNWDAEEGKEVLDEVFEIPGARTFGEVAIGTNYDIQQPTKNILFDEKIGGTIHMAVGQSYPQTKAVNQSVIHWDMISDMTSGVIIADGKRIYENGKFLI